LTAYRNSPSPTLYDVPLNWPQYIIRYRRIVP